MNDAEREVLEHNLETIRKYLIFQGNDGQDVLTDLTECYDLRLNEGVEELVAEIPHPFRAYYIDGQRSVVRAIKAALEVALNPPDIDDFTQAENDNEEEVEHEYIEPELDA